jgi:hypothetical protein
MADATAAGLVALGRRVVAAGLVVASGGNLAARLPDPDRILVTPRGWALDELDPAALATVGLDGRHISGAYAPTTELALHLVHEREILIAVGEDLLAGSIAVVQDNHLQWPHWFGRSKWAPGVLRSYSVLCPSTCPKRR